MDNKILQCKIDEDLYRRLKAAAALFGMTLSETVGEFLEDRLNHIEDKRLDGLLVDRLNSIHNQK